MTLWVFGDSFAQTTDNVIPDQWMHKAAAELGTNAKSLGLNGSSLEFTYQRFNIARKKIVENDIVVINLTGTTRRWFFKNFPHHNKDESPTGDKKETKAIQLYREHLDHNPEIHLVYLLDFLYNVHALTEKLNLKTIFLINFVDIGDFLKDKKDLFPLFTFANGLLLDLCLFEFEQAYFNKLDVNTIGDNDPRLNHLCKTNHLILADKIIDNIKNKTPIDLTNGFVKHLIKEESYNDPEFIKNELFDNIVETIYKKL